MAERGYVIRELRFVFMLLYGLDTHNMHLETT